MGNTKMPKAKCLSLKARFLVIFLSGMLLAVLSFLTLYSIAKSLLDDYFTYTSYVIDKEREAVSALEAYVRENKLAATDSWELKKWAKENHMMILAVSRDRFLLYENSHTGSSPLSQTDSLQVYRSLQVFHQVEFADGVADVFLHKNYQRSYYLTAIAVAAFVSALIWAFFFYLCIGPLLEAIDLQRQKSEEQETLVLGMVHDLRTPLTGLMGFLELSQRSESDLPQLQAYLRKAREKALQIRSLSDQLFDYFLSEKDSTFALEAPARAQYLLEDYLSELCFELGAFGFAVEAALEWPPIRISISMEEMGRILNNLLSNIQKYGDPGHPVHLSGIIRDKYFGIRITNHVRGGEADLQGTHIGLQIVRKMMRRMNGFAESKKENDLFQITLFFPIRK